MADFAAQGGVGVPRPETSAIGPSQAATHETADVDGRRVWATAAALAATIVLVGFMAAGAISLIGTMVGRPLAPIDSPPTAMPSPPLLAAPSRDLRALRAEKRALLSHYAWVDRAHGVVRIPIERAMALLIARGAGPGR
jgi:hypothetical protein